MSRDIKIKMADVSDSAFAEAVRGADSPAALRRLLNLPRRVPRKDILSRASNLGLDTRHFRVGKKKTNTSFACKWCGVAVKLKGAERPRSYCSSRCLEVGRKAWVSASMTEERRSLISESIRKSWADEGREKRLNTLRSPEHRARLRQAVRNSDTPELRAVRSANAKARWNSDPDFRDAFRKAAAERRDRWRETEMCLRRPHIKYVGPDGSETWVRSHWEKSFCTWCDRAGLKWEYEPIRVYVGNSPLTPDFLIQTEKGSWYVELHRKDNPQPRDTKGERMAAGTHLLPHPLLWISEKGVTEIRRQLRSTDTPLFNSLVGHQVLPEGLLEVPVGVQGSIEIVKP